MRDYAFTLAQPTLSEAIIPRALQCLKTAHLRRNIRKALLSTGKCPITDLADADLRHLLALPLSCDLTIEIERLKFLLAHDRHGHVGT